MAPGSESAIYIYEWVVAIYCHFRFNRKHSRSTSTFETELRQGFSPSPLIRWKQCDLHLAWPTHRDIIWHQRYVGPDHIKDKAHLRWEYNLTATDGIETMMTPYQMFWYLLWHFLLLQGSCPKDVWFSSEDDNDSVYLWFHHSIIPHLPLLSNVTIFRSKADLVGQRKAFEKELSSISF